jgi:Fe-S-cluster containining protein
MDDWPLKEKDITSDVCKRCSICCTIEVDVSLNPVGGVPEDSVKFINDNSNSLMNKGNPYMGKITQTRDGFMVACIHLDHKDDGTYECGIYNMRPRLCKNFNCVEWAKESGNLYQYNQALEKLGFKRWQ